MNNYSTKISQSALSNQRELGLRSFLITYSQIGNIVLEDFCLKLLDLIQVIYPVDSFTASCEFHKDKGRHFHIVLSFKRIVDINIVKTLLNVINKYNHIVLAKTPKTALQYILKDIQRGSKPTKDILYSSFYLSELEPFYGIYYYYTEKHKRIRASRSLVKSLIDLKNKK